MRSPRRIITPVMCTLLRFVLHLAYFHDCDCSASYIAFVLDICVTTFRCPIFCFCAHAARPRVVAAFYELARLLHFIELLASSPLGLRCGHYDTLPVLTKRNAFVFSSYAT